MTPQQSHEIGLDAYLYLYPLALMELTRLQATNVDPRRPPTTAPMNEFWHARAFVPPTYHGVVRPNYDVLFSTAWLDVSEEPMIVSAPDTHSRYYLLQMLDMWTDTFAVVGDRTTGTRAGNFAVVARGWAGTLPVGVQRVESTTPTVWILGRIFTAGPWDFPGAHAVQDGLRITPLSQWGRPPHPPRPHFDPRIDMTTPPPQQVAALSAPDFFEFTMKLLRRYGAHTTDQPILAQMKRMGLEPGGRLDFDDLDPAVRAALMQTVTDAPPLMASHGQRAGVHANGWHYNTDNIGVYGTSYLQRASIARFALGANLPEDAVYPSTGMDATGQPLKGIRSYAIRFLQGQLPPVAVYWSITLYDSSGFAVPNALNRFAIGSLSGLAANPDGSIKIIVSASDPGPALRSNWLPAPVAPFNLSMRLYGPALSVLEGQWIPPPIELAP